MKRVIVSVTNDLVVDQRVHKVCSTLLEQNFHVLLIGRKFSNSIQLKRDYVVYRMRLFFNKGFFFYAEFNIRLFFKLLFTKKDILLSNDLDTLLPNYVVSKLFRKKLVYDSHELFTEVPELINRPNIKKVWSFIEKKTLPKMENCYTVSNSIAKHYNNLYGSNFKVIRNLPYKRNLSTGQFPFNTEDNKIVLYQGALNIGRGIDLMIDTMDYLENVLFVIIGQGDIHDQLEQQVAHKGLQKKVRFLGRVTPEALLKITPLADIGISLEEDNGLNYRYALPNKLFDYIQAKIPVIISDLPEMRTIIETFNVGEILYHRSPQDLAKIINTMLEKGKKNWEPALNNAANQLIWEHEAFQLKEIFDELN